MPLMAGRQGQRQRQQQQSNINYIANNSNESVLKYKAITTINK